MPTSFRLPLDGVVGLSMAAVLSQRLVDRAGARVRRGNRNAEFMGRIRKLSRQDCCNVKGVISMTFSDQLPMTP